MALTIAQLISWALVVPLAVYKVWRKLDLRLSETESRLIRIEQQFHRNGGTSLRDSIDRIDRDVARLSGRFDQHIEEGNK